MYAVIESGGKQYRVAPQAQIQVEQLAQEPGEDVRFERVLLVQGEDGKTRVGQPHVDGVQVTGKLVEHVRGDKLVVFKKRRRKDSKRKQGHRQWLSVIEITSIDA